MILLPMLIRGAVGMGGERLELIGAFVVFGILCGVVSVRHRCRLLRGPPLAGRWDTYRVVSS